MFFSTALHFHPVNDQPKPDVGVCHPILTLPDFPEPNQMAYSKVKLQTNGDKQSPCFKTLLIGNV
jgi:hypothetical protein